MPAPIAGSAAPGASAIDALTGGPGAPAAGGLDQQRAQLEAFMGELRQLDQQVTETLGKMPNLSQIQQQIRALLKRAVQESVKAVPAQTDSGQGVPMAGA
jgi:hypothetical protein